MDSTFQKVECLSTVHCNAYSLCYSVSVDSDSTWIANLSFFWHGQFKCTGFYAKHTKIKHFPLNWTFYGYNFAILMARNAAPKGLCLLSFVAFRDVWMTSFFNMHREWQFWETFVLRSWCSRCQRNYPLPPQHPSQFLVLIKMSVLWKPVLYLIIFIMKCG